MSDAGERVNPSLAYRVNMESSGVSLFLISDFCVVLQIGFAIFIFSGRRNYALPCSLFLWMSFCLLFSFIFAPRCGTRRGRRRHDAGLWILL